MNDSKFLASNIKVLREESRLSIDEFANKIGVSKDRAREIEEGKVVLIPRNYLKFAKC